MGSPTNERWTNEHPGGCRAACYAPAPTSATTNTKYPMQHSRPTPKKTRPTMSASFDHFLDSAAAAWAPAMSPTWSRVLTLEELMIAGMASGQNKKIATMDIVMLLSICGGPGCAICTPRAMGQNDRHTSGEEQRRAALDVSA